MSPPDVPCLTSSHETLRRNVRTVLDEVVSAQAAHWEIQGHLPRRAWQALGARGLLGLPHQGDGFLDSAVLLEELGATGFAGVRAAVGVHAYMARSYLERYGTDEQRGMLDAVCRGERILALAITEESSGSDLRRLDTRAEPDGEHYRLTGGKAYVANGSQADLFVVLAATGQARPGHGLASASLLLVDADAPGVTRTPRRLLGWHSADLCEVSFDNVAVPSGRVIGRPGRALLHLLPALDFERLVAGLLAVGGVRHCLELLQGFARSHRIRDAALSANQVVRHRLADLTADFQLVRQYAYRTAWLHSLGHLDSAAASIVKLKSTELAVAAAQLCLQYHGARGYLDEATAARLYRDASAGTIAAGSSELLRELIFETS